MKSDRAGAVTNVDAARMSEVPTVIRSMNDIMRLTPQGANITTAKKDRILFTINFLLYTYLIMRAPHGIPVGPCPGVIRQDECGSP